MDFDGLKEGEAVEFEMERGDKGQGQPSVRPGAK